MDSVQQVLRYQRNDSGFVINQDCVFEGNHTVSADSQDFATSHEL